MGGDLGRTRTRGAAPGVGGADSEDRGRVGEELRERVIKDVAKRADAPV